MNFPVKPENGISYTFSVYVYYVQAAIHILDFASAWDFRNLDFQYFRILLSTKSDQQYQQVTGGAWWWWKKSMLRLLVTPIL